MNPWTALKGYRTILVNSVLGLPIAWDIVWLVIDTPEFEALIPEEWVLHYSFVIVVVNAWLRRHTSTPVGRRE